MRGWLALAALPPALAGGCSDSRAAGEPALIRQETGEEQARRQQAQRAVAARYQAALAAAPVYRSALRDRLIARPDDYRVGYRPIADSFRGLDNEFRCIHPPRVIARVQADGWQLVKCDAQSAMFYRPHGRDRLCRGERAVPDEFEILQLWFETSLTAAEDLGRRQTHVLYGALPGPSHDVPADRLPQLLGSASAEGLVFRRSDTNDTIEDFILDLGNRQTMSFHHKKRADSCMRNARGLKVAGRQMVTLDSPLANYGEMSTALTSAATYLAAD